MEDAMQRLKLVIGLVFGTALSFLAAASVFADGGNTPFPR
jgi:hypothetical protein